MELKTFKRISLKNNPKINEDMIQSFIFNNPNVLGLGELTAIQREKIQPAGGRLDILLADDDGNRYEVEIQLGSTDPSHIIRTIEYWDTERKRYKQYEHVAVIVAEEITGRFMNVIQLFNGNIPIVALQVAAYKKSDNELALIFTKVLDQINLADEEEDYAPTDRKYWENKSTKEQLALMDSIFKECEPLKEFEMKYNKIYIGLTKNSIATNPVIFVPKKKFIYMQVYRIKNEVFADKLYSVGISYDIIQNKGMKVRLNCLKEYTDNKALIDEMVAMAVANKS